MRKAKRKKNVSSAWSPQEVARLKRLHLRNTQQEISDQLGRSVSAITAKLRKLGLSRKPRVWSKRELNLLKTLYPKKTAEQIARKLGRPVPATRIRILKLGLRKTLRYEQSHRTRKGAGEKLCTGCGKWKRERLFSRNRGSKDRLAQWCKECVIKSRRKQ